VLSLLLISVEDDARKNHNKEDKWFKTPNDIQAKETTRPRFVSICDVNVNV
jgi:hypothetical protein